MRDMIIQRNEIEVRKSSKCKGENEMLLRRFQFENYPEYPFFPLLDNLVKGEFKGVAF